MFDGILFVSLITTLLLGPVATLADFLGYSSISGRWLGRGMGLLLDTAMLVLLPATSLSMGGASTDIFATPTALDVWLSVVVGVAVLAYFCFRYLRLGYSAGQLFGFQVLFGMGIAVNIYLVLTTDYWLLYLHLPIILLFASAMRELNDRYRRVVLRALLSRGQSAVPTWMLFMSLSPARYRYALFIGAGSAMVVGPLLLLSWGFR